MKNGDILPVQILARLQDFRQEIAIYVRQQTGGREECFGRPVMMEMREPNTFVEPTMLLEPQQAQQLMDELWQCGVRPTEGTGSAGSLAATERHLKDMRAVALGLLRKEGVEVER